MADIHDKVIFKYELGPRTQIQLPRGSRVLSVGTQGEDIFVWVERPFNTAAASRPSMGGDQEVTHLFQVIGTGHSFDRGKFDFVGTVQLQELGMTLVFHVYHHMEG